MIQIKLWQYTPSNSQSYKKNKKSTVLLTIISKLRRKESIDVFGLNTSYKKRMNLKTITRKSVSLFLCFAVILAYTVGFSNLLIADAAVDVGANPTPKIDIAVNVPADYPGTFLDYKQELTQKLKDQGLDPSLFRITSTAVSIDTTSMDGWHVYDHYHSRTGYNSLVPADQRGMQPYRNAGTSSMDTPENANILDYINKTTNKFTNSSCIQFNRHIGIYQSESGASNMAFAGYGAPAYSDYMIYPAPSSTTRTFSFNIDASVINTHTLTAFGFLMNAGITAGSDTEASSDDKLSGYLLYFDASSAYSGTGNVVIKKVNNINADSTTDSFSNGTNLPGSSKEFTLGAQKKVRLTVELKKDSITIQQQAYDASGNLSDPVDVLRNFAIPQFATETLNGLGPWVGYSSHGCSAFSAIVYTDLEMSYEASAFDALKYVQYYQGAEYKYFVNLAGASNNPGIPADGSKDYLDGINRMNNSKIFYISNAQDGKVVTDSTYKKNPDGSLELDELGNPILATNEDGRIVHQGLGASNGCIATTDDYVGQMAEFIAKNYLEGNHFQQAQISSELPLASFYVKNVEDDSQLMTIHLNHLKKNNQSVTVNIQDKSKIGTLSGADGKIAKYRYAVYTPDGKKVVDTGWKNTDNGKVSNAPDYSFNGDSTSGTYVFELTVRDQNENESKTFQTYLTAYLDTEVPYIEGRNETKNKATITLTDTGEGIDDDGITFIQDGRGSGVAAYWVTNSTTAEPTEDDWTLLKSVVHSYEFDLDIDSTDPIVIWVKDECGNIGNKAVFQPTHVRVEDKDGNPIDDYYVIDDKPIIVLPEDDVVPPSDDEDEYHTGWKDPEGNPITPGTTPEPDDNHEIIIRPDYSKDEAALVYIANGGTIDDKDQSSYRVTGGASILKKVTDQEDNVVPTREGYTFTGWKLLKSHSAADAANSTYINNASNVEEITTQTANATSNAGGTLAESDYYYLIAQWEIGKYTLKLDANGGALGNVRSISNVQYQQALTAADISTDDGTQTIPVKGRGVPTKAGYIFQGWSESKDNNTAKIFKFGSGVTGIPVEAPTMPASDKTVYAVWKEDTNKFRVTFDSNGGSKVSGKAYLISTATKYDGFSEPSRPGYTFDGWYLKSDLNGKTDTTEFGIVFEDGVTKPAKYDGTENVVKKEDHTFVAMWTPNDDTKYTIEYRYNTGQKNGAGEFIYKTVTDYTVTRTARTESTVTVQNEDLKNEITVDGSNYWYNADKSVTEGKVTGSPTLALTLYFDRYFDVTAEQSGEGTVNGASHIKEGETATVSWSPASGSSVKRIVIDGEVRDDLLGETSYTYPEGFHENHKIYVEFSKSGTTVKPDDNYFTIKTSVVGCPESDKYEITPTTTVQKGNDASVEWSVKGEKYSIVKVTVDGMDYDVTKTKVDFKQISSDHEVIVTLAALPTMGGDTTDGKYTITVNRYGGNGSEDISPSATVDAGDTYKVTWDVLNSTYQVYKVYVDGEEKTLTDSQKTKTGAQNFTGIKGNHVVDIYLIERDKEEEEPTYPKDEYFKVETQIVGGAGTITGSAYIKKDENYNVKWVVHNPDASKVDDPGYSYYDVDRVEVNGEVIEGNDANVALEKIQENQEVKVYLKPVLYNVTIKKFGEGTVSLSKTLYKYQNYRNILQSPAEGWVTAKIVVDGTELYVNSDLGNEPAAQSDDVTDTNTMTALALEDEAVKAAAATPRDTAPTINDITSIQEDHVIEVYFVKSNEDGTLPSLPDPADIYNVDVKLEGGTGNIVSGPALVESGGETTIKWACGDGYEIDQIIVNGVAQTIPDGDTFDLSNITEDKDVVIKLKKTPLNGNDKTIPDTIDEKELHSIDVDLRGVEGVISGDAMDVTVGEDRVVTWKPTTKFTANQVDENGEPVLDDEGNPVTVEVEPKLYYVYVVTGEGKPVKLDVTTFVPDADGTYTLPLEGISDDIQVVIVMGDPGQPDPKDPFKKPSIILPDVDIDTDGDGDPDINIDTDDDGDPDINIDTDGDNEPDINIDTDGDKEPDINIDTDGDNEPDVDIDTDGDGKPDINKDTTGDGKPDLDIDTDGDGKPDVNIDTDDDGKPDVNVDTDGDGVPDINIDTDGDGKPDVNIDTDGDGKPDENIKNPEELPGWTDDPGSKDDKNKPGKTDKPKTDELPWWIPTTGDQSSLVLWISLMGAALLAVCGLVWTRIRRKSAKENR